MFSLTALVAMVFGIGAFLAVVLSVVFFFLVQREPQGQAVSMPTSGILHSVSANFFGRQSAGVRQIRGNGKLVLGKDGVYFQRMLPARTYFVDYRDIHSIETPTSFLGKSRSTPLLQINFTNDMGETDAMAWQVGDVEDLKRMLMERTGK